MFLIMERFLIILCTALLIAACQRPSELAKEPMVVDEIVANEDGDTGIDKVKLTKLKAQIKSLECRLAYVNDEFGSMFTYTPKVSFEGKKPSSVKAYQSATSEAMRQVMLLKGKFNAANTEGVDSAQRLALLKEGEATLKRFASEHQNGFMEWLRFILLVKDIDKNKNDWYLCLDLFDGLEALDKQGNEGLRRFYSGLIKNEELLHCFSTGTQEDVKKEAKSVVQSSLSAKRSEMH